MKGAVVIDKWKLKIFERHLTLAGYSYKKAPSLTPDTLTLKVETDNLAALQKVITAAQLECKMQ